MSDENDPKPQSAGLTYAPAYDSSREFDPKEAEVIRSPEPVRREDFEFFRGRFERQATLGRVVLFVALILAVGINILLTMQVQERVIDNVDQARDDQAQLQERTLQRVTALEEEVRALRAQLLAPPEAPAAPPEGVVE